MYVMLRWFSDGPRRTQVAGLLRRVARYSTITGAVSLADSDDWLLDAGRRVNTGNVRGWRILSPGGRGLGVCLSVSSGRAGRGGVAAS